MTQLGFLRDYIHNNSDTPLDDVLNDEDFLEELKIEDDKFISYLAIHFEAILNMVIVDPSMESDYKRCFKYPFLAAEILSSNSPQIIQKVFGIENGNNEPEILKIFEKFSSIENEMDSTLPGYIEKILSHLIKNNPIDMIKVLNSYPVYGKLIERIDNESICEILFQFITLKIQTEEEKLEVSKYQKTKNSIIDLIFEKIKKEFQEYMTSSEKQNQNIQSTLEKLENSFIFLTKIIKFSFDLKPNDAIELLNRIISIEHFEIIENILFTFRDNKFNDESLVNRAETDIKLIQFVLTFFFNLLEATLIPPIYKNFSDVITSSKYIEEIIKHLNENTNNVADTTGINASNKNELNTETSTNSNDDLIEKNEAQPVNKIKIPNLFNYITEEVKINISQKFINLFSLFYEIANKIKIYTKNNKSFPTIDESIKIIPLSQSYLIFLDIFIHLLIVKNSIFKGVLISNNFQIFETLIQDSISYPSNSFLLNKILKIFEIILFDEFYQEIKLHLIENGNLFQTLLNFVNFKDFINLEEKIIIHKNYTLNYSHLMRLLNFFYVSNINSYEQENFRNFKLSIEELESFEAYLSVYINLTTRDLLSNEIQSTNELKNAGDQEIIINLEKNFYDSEAFLFTTKKIIENSKKVSQKLKEFDLYK